MTPPRGVARRPAATKSSRSLAAWRAGRVLSDLVAGLSALALTFLIRLYLPLPFTASLLPADRLALISSAAIMITLSQNVLLYFFGFYELPRPQPPVERLRRLATATSLQGLLLMGFYFLSGLTFPRTVIVLFVPLNLTFLLVARSLLDRIVPPPKRRAAIVGLGPRARELAEDINHYHWHGVEVAGHITAPGETDEEPGPGPCLGTAEELPDLIASGVVDDVILTREQASWQTTLIDRLALRPDARTAILLLPGPFDSLIGRMRYRSIHDIPLIEVVRETEWHARRPVKRLVDLVLAAAMLVLAIPVIMLCALAIRLTTHGPAFYSQERVGRDRKLFVLWKLRTMHVDAEQTGEEKLSWPDDPRLTRIGRLLRATRVDELPQLINVLTGSMSLVGPRPERPGFVQKYLDEVPGYAGRFSIPPGLTGLAQVNGDYHSSAENKLRYDLAYLANWSVWLDLTVMIRTIKIVLTSRGT